MGGMGRRTPQGPARRGAAAVAAFLAVAGAAHLTLSCFCAMSLRSTELSQPARGADSAVVMRAGGFGGGAESKIKRKRKRVSMETLIEHHGKEKAAAVDKVLRGESAESAEDVMRARYTACRVKDAVFMARSEVGPSMEARARRWAVTFGTEEATEADKGSDVGVRLLTARGLEVLDVDEDEVEFKIDCGVNGIYHERAIMNRHEKLGWIYSGDSVFDKWLDTVSQR
eukprot:TRINITY_DN24904_c0_g2_i1.p1 TRINITY_DN24904_c0_g2~~TRINITY_DN24904_c0_g2_i1.p1  ORF type:complete len:227 (-),score=72.93 TRINITY_DN24904_c0_g2_i1:85-765(-)